LIKKNYLEDLNSSKKPFIIYKAGKGFNLYTDFSQKIILTNNNIEKFINKDTQLKSKNNETDLFIGFFGYEILNNLIGVKVKRQKGLKFPKGIFYKPETKLKIPIKLDYKPIKIVKSNKLFKININRESYKVIFDKFKKKIKSGETYQIKICTKYSNKIKIDALDFFCRLVKSNMAPEAFMIKDKDYSIISCSPENLINKKNNYITTKPIAGTLKKTKKLNKVKALAFFKKNIKETKEHNMIVDMERSDLSKICKPGTVKILKKKNSRRI
jgi:para-aminobenzoate synthetase component 1